MIKLTTLLQEKRSKAAEEAEKLGLKHVGFGRYVKPENPDRVVAKSVQGKLVRIKRPHSQESPSKIPARRVRQKREKESEEQLSFKDILFPKLKVERGGPPKSIGQYSVNSFNDVTDPWGYIRQEVVSGEQTIVYDSQAWMPQWKKDKTAREWKKTGLMFAYLRGSTGYGSKEIRDTARKIHDRLLNNPETRKFAYADANRQHETWRKRLGPRAFDEIADAQATWQRDAQWKSPYRSEMNAVFNHYITRDKPQLQFSKEKRATHIERGMSLSPVDAAEFLKTFKVGSTVVLPPSGWTMKPAVARQQLPNEWSTDSDIYNDEEVEATVDQQVDQIMGLLGIDSEAVARSSALNNKARHIGVILKLYPKAGSNQMVGMHCSGYEKLIEISAEKEGITEPLEEPEEPDYNSVIEKYDLEEPDPDDFDSDEEWEEAYDEWSVTLENLLSQEYEDYMWKKEEWENHMEIYEDKYYDIGEYEDEIEVIRPGTVAQKVLRVRKHVFPGTGMPEDEGEGPEKEVSSAMIIYEIDLEDVGEIDKKYHIESAYDSPKRLTI